MHIVFFASGLHWFKIDGIELSVPPHFIKVICPGAHVQFACDHTRYNWNIQIETSEIRSGPSPRDFEILCAGKWVKLMAVTPVTDEHVSGWDGELLRMHQAFGQPTLLQQFRAKVGVYNILRYIIDRHGDTLGVTPAGKLKEMLDDGRAHDQTLQQLSQQCGYCADHLRILFKQEFGITPLEYHNRIRMVRAMSLIDNSDLRVKDVAEKSGFTHVPHFCTMFKKSFGMTPSQAIVKLRHK
ncbi:MAG: helix-turn-helix domain-containing protein [Sedimentisphaerales bacterium]|nr:helix-turn-helix domain-containing protein [Sedimentisphaerales bacterium]